MKIGILSMQRLINFGSFLQAYGLKHILEDLGHEVEFIDMRLADGTFLNIPGQYKKENAFKRLARRMVKGKLYSLQVLRQQKFFYTYFPLLELSVEPNEHTAYDAVVIGSDEVFSYCQFTKWGGTSMFFGQGIEAPVILSYAASFGYTMLADIERIQMAQSIADWLRRFRALSVRDQNSFSIVKQLTGKEPLVHLDPVLIYEFEALLPQIKEKNYILIYGYDNRLIEDRYVQQIKAFARKHHKKIISVGYFHSWCDKMLEASPFELLAYVKQADYVVCETFHGTVFSIKYQKQFAAIVRNSNQNKLMDLLQRFSLENRIFTGNENLESILTKSYDQNAVQQIIAAERKKTTCYFRDSLPYKENDK